MTVAEWVETYGLPRTCTVRTSFENFPPALLLSNKILIMKTLITIQILIGHLNTSFYDVKIESYLVSVFTFTIWMF